MRATIVSIAAFSLLLAVSAEQLAAQCPPAGHPLSETELLSLVRTGAPARVGQLVSGCGIDFEPTDEVIARLRSAHASAAVLDAVRAATGPAEKLWESIKDSLDPAYFHDYLLRYPRGKSAGEAQEKFRDLSIQKARPEIERALAASEWDVADEKIHDLLRSLPEDNAIRGWQLRLEDGREAERKQNEEKAAAAAAQTTKDAAAAQARLPAQCPASGHLLSEAELVGLVKTSPQVRVGQLVAGCGIAFEPTADVIVRLRSAGASAAVLDAVRTATRPPKVNPKDGLTYVWIPPGTFMMGCSPGDAECRDDEKPAHQVTITKGFWMGQTPVTQQAYQRVTGQNPSHFKGASLPVETVNWNEANAYCTAIGGRLPTEAEWEYAARAGSTAVRYGDPDEISWYERNSGGTTHEVGQKRANAFGLYDVLGNVLQWVADWYGSYQSGAQIDPTGRKDGQARTLRGGSWSRSATTARVSGRYRNEPGGRTDYYGLRCIGESPAPAPAAVIPPPPPPPAAPVITYFTANPASIQSGQSSELRWQVAGLATSVSINQGIGAVQNAGSQRVSPTNSTVYTLTARGPGGGSTVSRSVNVAIPVAPAVPAPSVPRAAGFGNLHVKANPADAGVFLDGEYMGPASAGSYKLPAGKYEVTVTDPRYEDLAQEVSIQPDKELTLKADLKPKPAPKGPFGTLRVSCDKSKAGAVFLNNMFVGSVGDLGRGLKVPAGSFMLEIRDPGGQGRLEQQITLAADKVVEVHCN